MSYIPHTESDRKAMLAAVGAPSVDVLFEQIPQNVRRTDPLDLPEAMAEQDLVSHMESLAGRNRCDLVSFAGAGCYDHYIPPAVDALASRSEFYTAYTPYQPEISQGMLQAFFEYQTMICELTGLDVANASMYDGATSLAEAMLLTRGVHRKKSKIVMSAGIHPEYRATVRTYFANLGVEIVEVPLENGRTDPVRFAAAAADASGAAFQSPNFLGAIEDGAALCRGAAKAGALSLVVTDPISLGILEAPAAFGADVVVGEGQGLGIPQGYGGPHFGFFAARKKYVRQLPGRIVGATQDKEGRRGFVLTFQTREQHIRREKATSNICTNQGLMALRATIYMSLLGPRGLAETARLCLARAHAAAERLEKIPGFSRFGDGPFFKEFALSCPEPAEAVVDALLPDGILAGVPLSRLGESPSNVMLVAVTEKRTDAEIEALASKLEARFPKA